MSERSEVYRYLQEVLGIPGDLIERVDAAEEGMAAVFSRLDRIMEYNQYKVLDVFHRTRVEDRHFGWHTGYGYDDPGRAALEEAFARLFRAEAALVRPTIVNGTHALNLTLAGILRPGDEMIYCTGAPYDTLEHVIGIRGEGEGSLKDFGIRYRQVELDGAGEIDLDALGRAITPSTRMVCVQRSTGYGWRKALTIPQIARWVSFVKSVDPNILCMVDNCYGEFLAEQEPTEVGVDVLAGSLIKNPGGGLALTGGYIAGKAELIRRISYRMTAPGIGGECGLTFGQTRSIFQGLFLAPRTVNGAVKGAALCAQVFRDLGFDVSPGPEDERSDIIQGVKLGSPEAVIAFCEGIQSAAPVDAHVRPVPWEMPGYTDKVIMAAGAFVQGSSIELSADAPIRPPYIVYFQGGLTYEHAKFGILKAMQALRGKGIL